MVAAVACAGIAACAAVAGIGGFEVDPCFDGGCGADATPDTENPDGDTLDGGDGGLDAQLDACACPEGTTRLPTGICALPTGAERRFITCESPIKLPDDCPTGVSIQVCDEDIDGSILYPNNICDGGMDYRLPSVYVQLGTSHTNKWISEIKGSFGLGAVQNCAQVSPQCLISPLAAKGVTNTGAGNKVEFALAKTPDSGCNVLTFITQPLEPDQ